MLKSKYRLTSKDINYIVRRGRKRHDNFFSWFIIPQYTNRKYHQISLHISKKVAKSAVTRRSLKRPLLNHLQNTHFPLNPVSGSFFKIFIITNKQRLETYLQLLSQKEKDVLIKQLGQTLGRGLSSLS